MLKPAALQLNCSLAAQEAYGRMVFLPVDAAVFNAFLTVYLKVVTIFFRTAKNGLHLDPAANRRLLASLILKTNI
jgi:hypothetical protein